MKITLDKLVNELELLATAHDGIESFHFGDFHDALVGDAMRYPCLIVTPQTSSLNLKNVNLTFAFILADRYSKDSLPNVTHCQSLMASFIVDLRAVFRAPRWREYMRVSESISIDPFIERGQDVSAGWMAQITFEIDDYEDYCQVPLTDYDLHVSMDIPGAECYPVTYKITDTDGNVLYSGTVASGGTLDQELADTTYDIYVDGVLEATTTLPTLGTNTLNIDL